MKILEAENLEYSYKKLSVLKGASFSLTPNESICVLGKNGAGKTTLFKCILGMLPKYKGKIILNSKSNLSYSVNELAKQLSYIPQSHVTIFNYSVFEIVLMGTNPQLSFGSSPSKKEEDIVYSSLEKLDILHLSQRGYSEISGGERQLVLIARALAQNAKIIIMDEPTANLDFGNQHKVMQQVYGLTQNGYSVIFSTHNPQHAFFYADKVLVLQDGIASYFGKPQETLTDKILMDLYNIPLKVVDINVNSKTVPVIIPEP